MASTFRVRRVSSLNDAAEWRASDAACFGVEDGDPPEGSTWWLAEHRDAGAWVTAGHCAATRSSQWTDVVYMSRVGVLPAFRGNGLQRRMLRVRERWARAWGFVWAVTDTNNPASANSLIGCGYRMFSPSRPWALASSSYWRKRL